MDKTPECTTIRNVRGTQQWAFTNRGYMESVRHGAPACVPHNVMFDRVAAEFGLDPTEVALKNDGCHGHSWDWVTQYQKENGFPERQSLKEVIDRGKKAIDWDRKWHPPGTKQPHGPQDARPRLHVHQRVGQRAGRNPCGRVFLPDAARRESRHYRHALRSRYRYRIRFPPLRGCGNGIEVRRYRNTGKALRQQRLPLRGAGRILRHHQHDASTDPRRQAAQAGRSCSMRSLPGKKGQPFSRAKRPKTWTSETAWFSKRPIPATGKQWRK